MHRGQKQQLYTQMCGREMLNDERPVCEITDEEIVEVLEGEEDVTWQYFD